VYNSNRKRGKTKIQWTTKAVGCYPIPSLKTAGGKKTFQKPAKNSSSPLTNADTYNRMKELKRVWNSPARLEAKNIKLVS